MVDALIDNLLRTAIETKHLVQLRYQAKDRIVEPHDYGIQNGSTKLLAYQVGGSSSGKLPNWRWMEADLISDVRLLDRTFQGGRVVPSGKHHKWDEIFVRVGSAETAPSKSDSTSSSGAERSFNSEELASAIAALGYPGFAQLRRESREDPALVLLAALSSEDLEVRVIESLPWLVVHHPKMDWDWLQTQAKHRNVQNRLGFIVTLARRLAEKRGDMVALRLSQIEEALRQLRGPGEDTLCQASLSQAERKWLHESRPADARYWNLLTDLHLENLTSNGS